MEGLVLSGGCTGQSETSTTRRRHRKPLDSIVVEAFSSHRLGPLQWSYRSGRVTLLELVISETTRDPGGSPGVKG